MSKQEIEIEATRKGDWVLNCCGVGFFLALSVVTFLMSVGG